MQNNSWIKLYRKTVDNGIMRDHTAWVIFSWLLLNVDQEGFRKIGRYQLCDELGIKPATYYKALERLEKKWGIIKTSNRIRFTEVWIVNWAKYQQSDLSHSNQVINTVETDDNESNTKQEYKNIRIENREGYVALTKNQLTKLEEEFPKLEVLKAYERFKLWQQANGSTFKNTYARFKLWLMDEKNLKKPISTAPFIPPQNLSPEEQQKANEALARVMEMKKNILGRKLHT